MGKNQSKESEKESIAEQLGIKTVSAADDADGGAGADVEVRDVLRRLDELVLVPPLAERSPPHVSAHMELRGEPLSDALGVLVRGAQRDELVVAVERQRGVAKRANEARTRVSDAVRRTTASVDDVRRYNRLLSGAPALAAQLRDAQAQVRALETQTARLARAIAAARTQPTSE